MDNLFFENSFDAFVVVGSDGYFKRVNPAFERVLGYTQEELRSRPLVEFLHPDDVPKTKTGIKTLGSGSATIASKNRYLTKDGTYRWFSWNTIPKGEQFFSVGRDVTEQIKSQEEIRKLQLALETKNRDLELKVQERVSQLKAAEAQVQQLQKMDAIGRLAGGIAHDFNNMLCAISLYCDALSDSTDLERNRDNVASVRRVTERAAALTRQLLVFSRKQIVQPRLLDFNSLVRELEKMLTRLIGEHIVISMKLADDLKTVKADTSHMEQVILNLVVNAKDAMPTGGKITIETKNVVLDEEFSSSHLSVKAGSYVLISVADTGIGMDSETMAKMYEPFFTTKEVGKGTGLGLATIYGIVKQCEGTIWAYSEPGRGTVFKIYLPAAEDRTEKAAQAHTPLLDEMVNDQTILLVEDDPGLRTGISTMLEKHGYRVLVASNGRDAITVAEEYRDPIHLLFTDIVIPGMTGLELTEKIKTMRKEIRVLYMSGYAGDAFEVPGSQKLSEEEFIQKPFTTTQMVAKLRGVLRTCT